MRINKIFLIIPLLMLAFFSLAALAEPTTDTPITAYVEVIDDGMNIIPVVLIASEAFEVSNIPIPRTSFAEFYAYMVNPFYDPDPQTTPLKLGNTFPGFKKPTFKPII